MGKNLDKSGVTYLWSKMKNYTSSRFSLKPAFMESITLHPADFSNLAAVITDSRIKEDSLIGIYYAAASIPTVNKAGIIASNGAGTITLTAKRTPESDITIETIEIRQR